MSEIDLVKVVKLRYLDKQSRGEIAKELSKNRGQGKPLYHDANVNHWLADAEDRGVIAFDIDSSFATTGQTDSQLSRELRDALGLGETWVVKYGENDVKATDLHVALANQTGRRLTEVASSNTRFLVAGGRTVVQIARKINRTTRPSPASNIRIDPLSGRNWTGHWQVDGEDDLERPLDADDAAVLMAAQFPKAGTRFSQIGHPLYAENPAKAKIIMRDHCAFLPNGKWNWNIHTRIDQAICGIGVLHPKSGHRIVRFLETYLEGTRDVARSEDLQMIIESGTFGRRKLRKPSNDAAYLSRVASELMTALTFAVSRQLGYFADIANRLYPCVPTPEDLKESQLPKLKDYAELVEKLDTLNRRAIVMQWSHLRNASTWVTAGGTLKFLPLWTLAIVRYIEKKRRPYTSGLPNSIMTHLTTDATTAQKLLDALKSFEGASRSIQEWYEDVAGLLFQEDSRVEGKRAS